jgi:hypothetical protein
VCHIKKSRRSAVVVEKRRCENKLGAAKIVLQTLACTNLGGRISPGGLFIGNLKAFPSQTSPVRKQGHSCFLNHLRVDVAG